MRLHVTLREVSIVRTLVLISLLCAMTAASAEIYRWTDANGKQIYGDEPPENARAVEAVELPVLTVAESFKRNSKPTEAQPVTNKSTDVEATSNHPTNASQTSKAADESAATTGYDKFSILVPGSDEVVRSNAGDVKIKIDLQPALKRGHGIVVYVDGRQMGETTSNTIDVTGIERGEHSVFAVLHDAQDTILGNTEAVNFTMMRNSLASRNNARSANSSSAKDSSTNTDDSSTLSNRRF